MSLSDGGAPMLTMPVSPTNSGGGFGWGGDNGVWLIVLFLIFAVCGGWGNNGWGGWRWRYGQLRPRQRFCYSPAPD